MVRVPKSKRDHFPILCSGVIVKPKITILFCPCMVKGMEQLKSPTRTAGVFAAVVDIGVFVAVGGIGVSVAVGGTGVFVAVGVSVGVNVGNGVGVTVGPNNCPGAQLDIAKLKSKTNIVAVRCLVFISSPALSRARPAAAQESRVTFDWVIVAQQESFVTK